ncbi:helix-turn-helix domain-containing protein [Spirosoma montaniterrae]|uniref:helix-turn-helix domain-containing protein n=1 Tax=Spirosoma montaniterrae TaxID=1178516 RepID=UPI0018DDD4D4|nr:AraC family transcriptional regulator [Spirosoma montaniterrae]
MDQHTEKPGKLDESQLEEYIPKSLVSVYDRQIREFMESQKAFLQRGYTLREMAETTGIPLHHLSAVINRHYGYHFNEYINHWRIEYLKQRLDKNEWKHKTLEALAQESGFTNRTSFITAFKKHCGKTPSDYIRTIKGTV